MAMKGLFAAVALLLAVVYKAEAFNAGPAVPRARYNIAPKVSSTALKLSPYEEYMASRGEKTEVAAAAPAAAAGGEAKELSPYEEYMLSRNEKGGAAAATSASVSTPSQPRVSAPSLGRGANTKRSYAKTQWQK